jgi:hypothetical protein
MSAETRLEGVPVKLGDTIDFIVDCRSTPDFDGFEWRVSLRADQEEWDAVAGFAVPVVPSVPAMSPWEKYAQVLLLSNEFVFVD